MSVFYLFGRLHNPMAALSCRVHPQTQRSVIAKECKKGIICVNKTYCEFRLASRGKKAIE